MGSRKSEKPPTHDSSNHTDHSTPQSKAQERLAQVSSHISQSLQPMTREDPPPRRRRRRNSTSQPPADYSDILAQLDTIKRLAATQDTTRSGYVRQKAAGKLWVRERVEQLLDKGSLREVGSAAGEVAWGKTKDAQGRDVDTVEAFTPSNSVQSFGLLGGRKVLLTADDYTLRAGHADGALYEKTLYIEKMALSLRLPILKLVDGSSGGGSVTSIHTNGFSYIPPVPSFAPAVAQLNAGIPNLAAILGPAIGLGAARATMCHFSVMAADVGASFNAGPKVVEGATFEEGLSIQELGGADMHCRNGTVDNVATDEQDAFRQLRTVLGYMPNLGFSAPPVVACDDPIDRREEALLTLIPQRKERMYDPRRVITLTVDKGSWFEIGALWGVSAIVGFARLGGRPVGIISNNCESGTGGAVDAASAQKMGKHLKLCDVMNLPVVQFVDVPGYAVGVSPLERSYHIISSKPLVLYDSTQTLREESSTTPRRTSKNF